MSEREPDFYYGELTPDLRDEVRRSLQLGHDDLMPDTAFSLSEIPDRDWLHDRINTHLDEARFEHQERSSLNKQITTLQARITELEAKAAAWDRLEELIPGSDFSSVEITYVHEHELEHDDEPPWKVEFNLITHEGSTLIEAVNAAGGES